MKSNLLLKIVVAVIFILAIVGMVMVATAGEDSSPEMASAANFVVTLAIGLLIVAAVLAIVVSLFSLLKNPAGLKKTLLGLTIFGVLFVVSYFVAQDNVVTSAIGEKILDAGSTSKWSGTGLIFSYILLAIGGVFFVVDLLRGLIKS